MTATACATPMTYTTVRIGTGKVLHASMGNGVAICGANSGQKGRRAGRFVASGTDRVTCKACRTLLRLDA